MWFQFCDIIIRSLHESGIIPISKKLGAHKEKPRLTRVGDEILTNSNYSQKIP